MNGIYSRKMSQEEKKPEVQAEQSPPPQEGDANADLTVFVEQLLGDMVSGLKMWNARPDGSACL